MLFQEPKIEVINIGVDDIATSSCTTDANQSPSMQACSVGSAHEASCSSEGEDWVD